MASRRLVWPISASILVAIASTLFITLRTHADAQQTQLRRVENTKLLRLQLQEARLLERHGKDHPAVRSIRAQIQEIQKFLGDSPSKLLALNADDVVNMDRKELRGAVSLLINEVRELRERVVQLELARKPKIIPAQSR